MAKKHLGQNFLFDPSILTRIVEAAGISAEDTVVEIGPGHGSLTRLLARAARKVIAIELDPELYQKLSEAPLLPNNVTLVFDDALKYRYEELESFKVVANIPYYITTPIIFRLLDAKKHITSMTLTIQREVAERIVASPGTKDYGALSIGVQFYANPRIEFIVPRSAFRPVPKVDSAVVHIQILDKPRAWVRDEKLFFKVVKTAFAQRRKTLSNALKPLSKDIREMLAEAGIDPIRRAETLSIEEFAKLADHLSKRLSQ
ncbi:MAG: 16S rRNA (adenine(1518)-N(6)/adenine(1519)-N(6))-dimethyltransferase RsmA [Nitrospirota bacterium]